MHFTEALPIKMEYDAQVYLMILKYMNYYLVL